jgi:hypothetical protein
VTRRRTIQIVAALALFALLAWAVNVVLQRLAEPPAPAAADTDSTPPEPADVPHITATLFYAGIDGQALLRVQREVPLATGTVPQGREILMVLMQQEVLAPYVSVIPPGTTLRAFYVTERGDAFVDLSGEVTRNHPGGSFAELLTVYAIVNSVITNLPTVQRVQILIDGKEAETLAGHVDLRRPLTPDLSIVRGSGAR